MAWQEQRAPGRKIDFLVTWLEDVRRQTTPRGDAAARGSPSLAAKRRLLVGADEMHLAESPVARAAALG
jgi:hypothetical protein